LITIVSLAKLLSIGNALKLRLAPEKRCPKVTFSRRRRHQTPHQLFREYAAEFMELARKATSVDERFLYLKMANIWQETAIRWERDLLKDQKKLHGESAAEQ
jgi:hypothetical protein